MKNEGLIFTLLVVSSLSHSGQSFDFYGFSSCVEPSYTVTSTAKDNLVIEQDVKYAETK